MQQQYQSVLGGRDLFRRYSSNHRLDSLAREMEPYLEKFPTWLAILSPDGQIAAITPINDNSRDRPEGNRRVKSANEICPFAESYEAAVSLVDEWELRYPNATRFCDIRIPVENIYGSRFFSRALRERGYRCEAIEPNLFTINGKEYTVLDFGKNHPDRMAEFGESDVLVERVMRKVFFNEDLRPMISLELERERQRLLQNYEIRRAKESESTEIAELLEKVFPVYGTYNLRETMPALIADRSQTSPIVYVAVSKSSESVRGTCTVDPFPFAFGELTDVAVLDGGNGLGTAMCYSALIESRETRNVRHWWSDDVPHPAMNKIARRLGGGFRGIHENQVRIITQDLLEEIRRVPDSMDLVVCSGSTEFR